MNALVPTMGSEKYLYQLILVVSKHFSINSPFARKMLK